MKSVVLFLSPRVFLSLPWESTQIRKCNTTEYTRDYARVYVLPINAMFPWDILDISSLR